MFRRFLGFIILLVSLIMVALLLGGAYFMGQAVDSAGVAVNNILTLTVDSLDTVSATLEQTQATIVEANNSIATAVSLTENLSKTVADTRPLMDSMTTVVSEDVPDNIEAIQSAIPNVANVAGVVDQAMTTLSNFGIEQTIPIPFNPITLEFDLGIDYEPEEPFDETILFLGDSLEGLPEELRSLSRDLETLSADLDVVSADILTASGDIEALNEQVALFIPILDDYLAIVDQISTSLVRVQSQILAQLDTVKSVGTVVLIFLALTQLTPLYVGWELITGQRGKEQQAETVEKEPEEDLPPPLASQEVVQETQAPPATVIEDASPETRAPEDFYDPAADTVIEGSYVDPSESAVDDSLPTFPDDDKDRA